MNTKQSVNFSYTLLLAVAISAIVLFASCKKEEDQRVPPDIEFKIGTGYVSGDATVGMGDTLLVGIHAEKTEDELKTFNISHAYDGASTSTTFLTETLSGSDEELFEEDFEIVTRNQAGTEKWIWTVTDRDGNVSSINFTLTVQ